MATELADVWDGTLDGIDRLEDALAKTRAENERLRAALEKIAEAATPYPETLRRIAHDALAQK